MKPKPPDLDSPGTKIKMNEIEPYITNEENETLLNLVRKNKKGERSATIVATFVAGEELTKVDNLKKAPFCRTTIKIDLNKQGKLSDVKTTFKTNSEEIFYRNEILIYAYSASRVLGKLNLSDRQLDDTIPGFIEEHSVLFDAQEILHTANYARLGSHRLERAKYKRFLENVQKLLISLLPDFKTIKGLEILTPRIFENRLESGLILVSTRHGKEIPFENFSLGYKTVMSWTVDLAWRLLTQFTNSKNPLAEPAIVIVDELDLHLHPQWQLGIMNILSKHFPKVQFIATAHSPLMVQEAANANYSVLKQIDGGVQILNKPTDIRGWRVDQILTSDLFDLPSARGERYDELLNKRNELAHKLKLTVSEKRQLNQLNEQLSRFPAGKTADEVEKDKLIDVILSKYKTQNSVK
jgi:hypothetical protein